MEKTEKLRQSLLTWQTAVLAVFSALAAQLYYRQISNHSTSFIFGSVLILVAPAVVLAIIAFGLGKRSGIAEGFNDGLVNGKYQGDYTIDLLRRQLLEKEKRIASLRVPAAVAADSTDEKPETEPAAATANPTALLIPEGDCFPQGVRLTLALAVQKKFWHPDRFVPTDRDTTPSQRDIIEWIKQQQPTLSNADAAAIEKVACPIQRTAKSF